MMADTNLRDIASVDVFRRLVADRPNIPEKQIHALFEKHDLSTPSRIDEMESSIINRVYRITCRSGDVYFMKASVYKGSNLDVQALVTKLLVEKTELPVSRCLIFDSDLDEIAFPCLITSPLAGVNGRAFFEQAPLESQTWLLQSLGSIVRQIHSVPVPSNCDSIGATDVRDWDTNLRSCLLGHSDLAESLVVAAAPQVAAVIKGLSSAKAPSQSTELVLVWGDPSLQNIMVEDDRGVPRITGIHDFEHATRGQALHDIRHVIADFEHRKVEQPCYGHAELLEAFYDGYGCAVPTAADMLTIRLIEVAWKWRCI